MPAKKLLLYYFPLFMAPGLRLVCQPQEIKDYFKVGIAVNQVRPVASDLGFNLTDPGSGLNMHQPAGIKPLINNYGLDVGFIEVVRPNGLVINPFDVSVLLNGNRTAWLQVGIGAGYEVALLKNRKDKPLLKFRAGLQIAYGFYEYHLFSSLGSPNGNTISVSGTAITNRIRIDFRDELGIINPSAGFNCRITSKMNLHLLAIYNYVFAQKEQLYFYEDKLYYSKYEKVKGVKTNDDGYISDSHGKGVHSVFSLAPLMFKIELAFIIE